MRIKKNQKSVENELKLEMRCEEQMMLRTVAAWAKKWVVSERFTPEFKRLIDGLEDW